MDRYFKGKSAILAKAMDCSRGYVSDLLDPASEKKNPGRELLVNLANYVEKHYNGARLRLEWLEEGIEPMLTTDILVSEPTEPYRVLLSTEEFVRRARQVAALCYERGYKTQFEALDDLILTLEAEDEGKTLLPALGKSVDDIAEKERS
jgi:hypothetical protein